MTLVRSLFAVGIAQAAASIRPSVLLRPEVIDLTATPDEVIEHLRRRLLDGDEVIAGDGRRIVRRFSGRAGRLRYATVEVVGFEPDAVTFEHLRGPFSRCRERFALVRTETGSTLTHSGIFSLRGGLWTWPFALLAVRPAFEGLVTEHLRELCAEVCGPGAVRRDDRSSRADPASRRASPR